MFYLSVTKGQGFLGWCVKSLSFSKLFCLVVMSNKTSDKILSNKKLSNINIVEQKIVEQNIIGHQHCQSKWYSPIKYLTPIVGSLTKIGEVTVHMIGHPIVMQKNLTHPSSKMFNWKKVCQKISLFFSLVTLQGTVYTAF